MSSDPFRSLHLLPHAARDLIVQAHALLAARAERECDAICAAGLRVARDEALAFTGDDIAHSDASSRDHYATLAIADDADAEVIMLAYRVAIAGVAADCPDDVRNTIEEARATLTNTYRRARYDAELQASVGGATTRVAIAPAPPGATLVAAAPGPDASPAEAPPSAYVVAGDVQPEQLPLAFDPPPHVAARRGVLRRRVRNRPKKLSAPVELHPHIAPLLPRLCDEGELVAELRFIEGPLAGTIVPVANGKLTLGASPEHDVRLAGAASMRIWRLDGRYLLRRIDGDAVIDGVAMTLPAAQLEAGTVVDTGPHRAVFAFRRVPAASQQGRAPMLSAAAGADDRVAR